MTKLPHGASSRAARSTASPLTMAPRSSLNRRCSVIVWRCRSKATSRYDAGEDAGRSVLTLRRVRYSRSKPRRSMSSPTVGSNAPSLSSANAMANSTASYRSRLTWTASFILSVSRHSSLWESKREQVCSMCWNHPNARSTRSAASCARSDWPGKTSMVAYVPITLMVRAQPAAVTWPSRARRLRPRGTRRCSR